MESNVSCQRRLQTLSVCTFLLATLILIFLLPALFIYLFFTKLFFLPLIYLVWYIYDFQTPTRGGRKVEWFLRMFKGFGRKIAEYFPITLIKTTEVPTDRKYIFVCHPHGIFPFSYAATFAMDGINFSESFPGITTTLVTLAGQHYVPVIRELCLLFGTCSCSRKSIDYLLGPKSKPGTAVALVVGGTKEMMNAHPKTMRLILKNRKGFCRMALRHGASLVPIISFGVNDMYNTIKREETTMYWKIQDALYKYTGAPILWYTGRGGLLPFRVPIYVVVGKPIDVEKVPEDEPSQEQIDELHQRYMKELTELYDQYKEQCGYGNVPLEFC